MGWREWVDARSPLRVQRATIASFDDIGRLIEPTLTAMGFELVIVRVHGGQRPRLLVMAEPTDRQRRMTVEDCAEISHAVSAVLDVADPIAGAYTLEVSSPGIDRPLVRREDFVRFAGERVRLETEEPIAGRRRFLGRLEGIAGDDVLIEVGPSDPPERVSVPLACLKRARLAVMESITPAPRPKPGGDGKRKGSRVHGQ